MKATWTTMAVALLVACICAQTPSCDATSNKVLKWIKSIDANAVVDTPITDSSFQNCNDVWKVSGTCCKTAELKLIFIDKLNAIKTGWTQFIDGLVKVKPLSERLQAISASRD